ncbi:potassium transporter 5-like protein [Cinnamomum micranthum f. kanehirae]|uniref:Potassium transporter 5-like protein n=1 Tax=Cinnamomum micranthum f. kanehirae TaxID=337451 RepID=A0A3S3QM15_9MAGN|nr:potassium transporter 5-like protein [Cinnamomum micranthum f. kanehirae]
MSMEIEEIVDNEIKDVKGKKLSDNEIKDLKGKKLSGRKLRRYDSLDIEANAIPDRQCQGPKALGWIIILKLAFQSIGIVYGDIGTSPLYVYSSTFVNGVKHKDDILGVLSLTYYTLFFIPLIKYVFIALRANDNGEGGTFALYSKLCRYAKVGMLPSQQAEDRDVSNYELKLPSNRQHLASKVKSTLENSPWAKYFLLLITMLGTSMVIGDGVITPCISVLSAVGGIKEATSAMTEERIVWVSTAILVCLFMVQRFGTEKVGYIFAPILTIWFLFIGAEALFADVGHFSVLSIQISACCVVFPSIVLAYTGQAAYLSKHSLDTADAFYKSVPGPVYWYMFVVAVLAAIIASQALISASFSIIQQSLSLGCFPCVKIVHTSSKYKGQVYIPEINYILMLACVGLTLGFKDPVKIGNAYGMDSSVICYVNNIGIVGASNVNDMEDKYHLVELLYLTSVLYKFTEGGYLPLAISALLMTVMYVWNYVYRKKYTYELDNKISSENLREIVANVNSHRLPGIALFYSDLVQGIPRIFRHYVDNVPSLHSVLIFVSIKSLPISKVLPEERFRFRLFNPRELGVFCCFVRYGYTDLHEHESFERTLVDRLKEFIRDELQIPHVRTNNKDVPEGGESDDRMAIDEEEEIELIEREYNAGIVHLLGKTEVVASKGSNFGRRILIDYAYNILKRNIRERDEVLNIPRNRLLKVEKEDGRWSDVVALEKKEKLQSPK